MPDVNSSFEGVPLILPGAYAADNVNATLPTNPTVTPPLVFIGFGYGGKPKTPLYHSTSQGLLNQIRGGPASAFVQFFMNPSNELNGAQQVTYLNPGSNTQSTLNLADATPATVITLTSANYGTPSNLMQAEVAAGAIGGIDLTIFDGYSGQSATGNNLGIPFQLATTATTAGTTYSVTVSGGVATAFVVSGSTAGQSASFPLGAGQYATVSQLVEALNGTGFYVAQTISDTNGNLPTSSLDAAATLALAASIAGVYTYVNVTAILGDPVFWVNNYQSALATAALGSVASTLAAIPVVIPLTYFTGATNVVPTLSDYAACFNIALTLPGWVVITDSNIAGIAALGTQHAMTASSITNHRYRRFFTGSSVGDTIAATQTNARDMNAMQASYFYPGIYRTDLVTGVNTLYGGLYVAAAGAGIAAGNRVAVPMTNKSLVGNGVEVALTTPNINQLQQAGVICLRVPDSTSVPTIVRDLTTWQNDNNPENVNNQQVACRQALAYSLIATAQPYVGQIDAGATSLGRVKNAVKALLNALVYTGSGSSGILASWDATSLVITYDGSTQTLSVVVNVVLVGQNIFITIFVPIQPLTATA